MEAVHSGEGSPVLYGSAPHLDYFSKTCNKCIFEGFLYCVLAKTPNARKMCISSLTRITDRNLMLCQLVLVWVITG